MIRLEDIVNIDYSLVERELVKFLRDTLEATGAKGYVIGLSGGVDSSTSFYLALKAVGKDRVQALILPDSMVTKKEDVEDAWSLAKQAGVRVHRIDIAPIVDTFKGSLPIYEGDDVDRIPLGNLRARIRMCLLYYYANKLNYLVLGTTDRSEWLIGYYTKYGDGAVDVEPIIVLYKSQVRRLAAHLGVPERIAFKPSSPGLWPGHMAEEELGVSYDHVDLVLHAVFDLGLKPEEVPRETGVPERVVERVLELYRVNEHKRNPPLAPSIDVVKKAGLKTKL
ncbi:MAG: NAD+ synthase [Desulfurococcales archaeon]|nr:NAD+ synthase [Desulfurococcales archaeon]